MMKSMSPETEKLVVALEALMEKYAVRNPYLVGEINAAIAKSREESTYDPTDEILLGWCLEDMHTACQQHGKDLSGSDALILLKKVADRFDANVGVDWEGIWTHAVFMAYEGEITLFDYEGEDED